MKNSFNLIQAVIVIVFLSSGLCVSAQKGSFNCGDNFTDARDGQVYQTVYIETQCWMSQNLNVGTRIDGASDQTNNGVIEKYCFDDDENNCTTYGGLYQWNEMMKYVTTEKTQGICPDGWHLPSDAEIYELERNVDPYVGSSDATGWRGEGLGFLQPGSSYGFNLLLAGQRLNGGLFTYLNDQNTLWSSSAPVGSQAWGRFFYSGEPGINRNLFDKITGASVRCILGQGVVSVNEYKQIDKSIKVYPEPAYDFINLDINNLNQENLKAEIFDVLGKSVYSGIIVNLNSQFIHRINVSNLNNGVYILKLLSNDYSISRKIIIKH